VQNCGSSAKLYARTKGKEEKGSYKGEGGGDGEKAMLPTDSER